jgi:N-acetyl-anhydromuramyl-L-alanine amidase AmpD
VAGRNSSTVGIELAHSGRREDPFPRDQARSAAWLVGALLQLSRGRLSARDVVGHKDLDREPAFVADRCRGRACLAYVDGSGRPFRRRVDPPESLFEALAREGLRVPREGREGDVELARAEAIPRGEVPRTERP